MNDGTARKWSTITGSVECPDWCTEPKEMGIVDDRCCHDVFVCVRCITVCITLHRLVVM